MFEFALVLLMSIQSQPKSAEPIVASSKQTNTTKYSGKECHQQDHYIIAKCL